MKYDGLEVVLVRLSNGLLGKVSVNADCIMPYRIPFRIFGSKGSVLDNRVWSPLFPEQLTWVELPGPWPDSRDVRCHPFQGEIGNFVECLQAGGCNQNPRRHLRRATLLRNRSAIPSTAGVAGNLRLLLDFGPSDYSLPFQQ
jgi:predicted dehydrogenase